MHEQPSRSFDRALEGHGPALRFFRHEHHSSESAISELPENRFLTTLDPDFIFVTADLVEKDLAKPDSPCRMMKLRLQIAAVSHEAVSMQPLR